MPSRAMRVDVTVLGLVGGAPGGETPRVADSSAAGAGRFFHNSVPPSKLNRLGKPPRTMCAMECSLVSYCASSRRCPGANSRLRFVVAAIIHP